MDKRFLKILTLPQADERWVGTVRRAPFWIFPGKQNPYRPFLFFLATTSGKVIRTEVQSEQPGSEEILQEFVAAMKRPTPGSGSARRPQVIALDNRDHVASLSASLAEFGIHCEFSDLPPVIEDCLYSMEREVTRREPSPGLLKIPSVTLPLVKHLFQLCADFYATKPWQYLNDNHPIEIRVPPEQSPRYAVVMGSGGEIFGLAVYNTLEDLRLMYQQDFLSQKQIARRASWLVLFFDEATAMRFDDLDLMESKGWTVANETAYPFIGRTSKTLDLKTPSKSDLLWMEGALAGILAYLQKHQLARWGLAQPFDDQLSVKVVRKTITLDLRFPDVDPIRGYGDDDS
ncbi:MAG: hypothetical protein MUF49_26325 [Oculatellaceae cyanobacterium Prado106]|jgi:hypothetical protein|nr:hypothetical protein [Oculatellaceae cyanobacterium Prado106]